MKLKQTWENVYEKGQWGEYPETQFITFVARNYYNVKDMSQIRFLDIGCGIGAATLFLAEKGFVVDAFDISENAVNLCRQRLKERGLNANVKVMDAKLISQLPDESYDCIFEISVLQYNPYNSIKEIIKNIHKKLKPNGKFFGLMVADSIRLKAGTYGNVHFYTKEDLKELFNGFKDLYIGYVEQEHRTTKNRFWIVEAEK